MKIKDLRLLKSNIETNLVQKTLFVKDIIL
jgi:hypothetical protein